jgi:hypothetical protein
VKNVHYKSILKISLYLSLPLSLTLILTRRTPINENSDWYDLVLSQCCFSSVVSQSNELLSSKGIKREEEQQQEAADGEGEA